MQHLPITAETEAEAKARHRVAARKHLLELYPNLAEPRYADKLSRQIDTFAALSRDAERQRAYRISRTATLDGLPILEADADVLRRAA